MKSIEKSLAEAEYDQLVEALKKTLTQEVVSVETVLNAVLHEIKTWLEDPADGLQWLGTVLQGLQKKESRGRYGSD